MTTYTIYLDRIEIAFDDYHYRDASLVYKLTSLSNDLYHVNVLCGLGKGVTYRRLSLLIDNLVKLSFFCKDVDEVSVVGVLRYSLCFLRRFKFPDFQIILLNHV